MRTGKMAYFYHDKTFLIYCVAGKLIFRIKLAIEARIRYRYLFNTGIFSKTADKRIASADTTPQMSNSPKTGGNLSGKHAVPYTGHSGIPGE